MSSVDGAAASLVKGHGRLVAWGTLVTVFSVLSYLNRFLGEEPPEDLLYTYDAAVTGALQFAVLLGIVLAISRPWTRSLLALRRPLSWPRALGLALGVLVAVLAVGGAIEPLLEPGEEQGLLPPDWEPDRAGAFAANFAVVAGVAPVVEELTFRGLGFGVLERFGGRLAVALSGLAFAAAHGLVRGLPLLLAIGLGLGYLRYRTRSVYPGMLLHGAFNALVLIVAVAVDP
jgi:uncharacterized protein